MKGTGCVRDASRQQLCPRLAALGHLTPGPVGVRTSQLPQGSLASPRRCWASACPTAPGVGCWPRGSLSGPRGLRGARALLSCPAPLAGGAASPREGAGLGCLLHSEGRNLPLTLGWGGGLWADQPPSPPSPPNSRAALESSEPPAVPTRTVAGQDVLSLGTAHGVTPGKPSLGTRTRQSREQCPLLVRRGRRWEAGRRALQGPGLNPAQLWPRDPPGCRLLATWEEGTRGGQALTVVTSQVSLAAGVLSPRATLLGGPGGPTQALPGSPLLLQAGWRHIQTWREF